MGEPSVDPDPIKATLSDVIHSCVMEVLQFPGDKRAHPVGARSQRSSKRASGAP